MFAPSGSRFVALMRRAVNKTSFLLFVVFLFALKSGAEAESRASLEDLVQVSGDVKVETHAKTEYLQAAASYRDLLADLQQIDLDELGADDRVDARLLEADLRTHLFEIEELRLFELIPVSYLALSATNSLFVRPCSQPDKVVAGARDELERLPKILGHARENLTRPARVWTENAIYTCYYAQLMLEEMLSTVCVDDPDLGQELVKAGSKANRAVARYSKGLESDLLARSDRDPSWRPEEVEFYQFTHEGLEDYGVEEMIRIAAEEESETLSQMEALARRIHPSGDLATVWELMKSEAPPWPEVFPMAERYVAMADGWLRGPGSSVVEIPKAFDYGVQITAPMGRRILSFGGASYGPTLAGRISGYYVLTPLEDRLTDEEKLSRIKAYNPYWTHVISYHEWVGHNVQRAIALKHVSRPMRQRYRSIYLSQAWSFYLEKLLEDEGYFEAVLPHAEALKTRMARLQMRMWRIQRILTKLRMATGEMSFDQAVNAYVEKIGMEPANAYIEVQRDSQNPSPPGREIIGEKVILEMRDEYKRRFGEHFSLRDFHEALLSYGELPLPTIRGLMFGDQN
jgi:hypothetical protein